jgi:hypothetical protein
MALPPAPTVHNNKDSNQLSAATTHSSSTHGHLDKMMQGGIQCHVGCCKTTR